MVEISLPENRSLKDCLPELAESIVHNIIDQDPEHCQEVLGTFVSQLFLLATKQTMRRERRAKQLEGIAKAKANGVQFGVKCKPLPDNFDEVRTAWRNHEMNLKDAAELCGMPSTTFYDAVRRAEKEEGLEQKQEQQMKGIRFGVKRKPLPDNFDEVRIAWRSHEVNMKDAAKLCGMPTTTFYDAVRRAEEEEQASR